MRQFAITHLSDCDLTALLTASTRVDRGQHALHLDLRLDLSACGASGILVNNRASVA
jgi:hypothetical protein